MRWVLSTPLGVPVEPEVNKILAIVSGPTSSEGLADVGARRHLEQPRKRDRGKIIRRLGAQYDLRITDGDGADGRCEARTVCREEEAGSYQLQNVFELAVILRHERVRG